MPEIKKFVILSDSRSGTSLLSETLNSHPEIVCHGEVFHPTPAGHIKISQDEASIDELVELRENDSDAFMETIYNRPDARIVGFKMWRNQNAEVCDEIMADESIAKIIYERTNILARFASSRLVKATGIYNLKPGAGRPEKLKAKICFNDQDFNKYARRHHNIFSKYRAESKGPVLDITYQSVVENGFEEVLSFLGVEQVPLINQKEKLHSSSILERFQESDHGTILETIKSFGHPNWIRE